MLCVAFLQLKVPYTVPRIPPVEVLVGILTNRVYYCCLGRGDAMQVVTCEVRQSHSGSGVAVLTSCFFWVPWVLALRESP